MRMPSFLPLCNADADIRSDRSNKIPMKGTGNMYVLHREARGQIIPDLFVEIQSLWMISRHTVILNV